MSKHWIIVTLVAALAATLAPDSADARRLGGGKSTGMQRDMPARTAPDATPAKPAAPAQQAAPANTAATPAAGAAANPAAAAGKRSWLGPIAGLAAGLGLAALMSHLGLGEAFANFLMLALLVMAGVALFMFVRRRMASPRLAAAGAGGMARSGPTQVAWPTPPASSPSASPSTAPADESPTLPVAPTATGTGVFVPAAFDHEAFERIARMIFIRMQAANDSANLDDLRQFTTPEMFAAARLELLERGTGGQTTDVQRVDAKVLDVAEEAERQVVSVRFRGEVVESAGGPSQAFDEVWHFVKARGGDEAWRIAGIEQMS